MIANKVLNTKPADNLIYFNFVLNNCFEKTAYLKIYRPKNINVSKFGRYSQRKNVRPKCPSANRIFVLSDPKNINSEFDQDCTQTLR